jgi:hypothetical protein
LDVPPEVGLPEADLIYIPFGGENWETDELIGGP